MKTVERLLLLQVLGNMTGTFKQIEKKQDLTKRIGFDEKEREELGMKTDTEKGTLVWDITKDNLEGKKLPLDKDDKEVLALALDQYKANLEEKKGWNDIEYERVKLVEALVDDKK